MPFVTFTTAISCCWRNWCVSSALAVCLIAASADAARAQRRPSPAIGPSQLYFVAVGSQDYVFERKPGSSNGFDPVRSPEHSARRVAEELIASGARYGILLTSDRSGSPRSRMVTRQDVQKAIIDLKTRVRSDGATTPRIVFYFMGHGYGDAVARQLVMIPGTMAPLDVSQSNILSLQKRGIWSLDVVSALVNFRVDRRMSYMDDLFPSVLMPNPFVQADLMEAMRAYQELERRRQQAGGIQGFKDLTNPPVPFVAMFDNCYNGIVSNLTGQKGLLDVIARTASKVLDQMLGDLEDDGLVLYAGKPGDTALDYPDPAVPYNRLDEKGPRMGLLGARLVMALRERDVSRAMRFSELAGLMQRPLPPVRADGANNPDVPYSISRQSADVAATELLPARQQRGQLERRLGTGTVGETETCCH